MAVNGKGDNDNTKWNVIEPNGTVAEAVTGRDKKVSKLTGLTAAEAFGQVRRFRADGITVTAVRT